MLSWIPHIFAHTLRNTQDNQTHNTTKHSTGAMLVQKKGSGPKQPKQEPEEVDVKKIHCVYAEQPDSGTHGTQSVFSFS